ncbi:MAG: hypothetical protein JW878_01595 [Methanomicrobia archaeon]|nr:hypothetical protein [Methanomicrobia archaeon]
MSNLDELRKRIAYFIDPQNGEFEDDDLLEKATLILKKTPAYRIYGLLGDAILKVVVYEELLRESEPLLQGEMHEINKGSEMNDVLGEFGESKLALSRYIDVTNPSVKEHPEKSLPLYANVFEAIVGVIFLKYDYETASTFLENIGYKKLIYEKTDLITQEING